jgi:hypothetical protein
MSPEEVICKFVSFELMLKDSKHIVNLEQGATSTPRCNPLHSKQHKKRMKSLHQVDYQSTPPSLTTRRWLLSLRAFDKSSNKGMGRTINPIPRGWATSVVSPVISLQNVHIKVTVTRTTTRKGKKKMEKKRYYKKGGEAHMGWEWDSDEISTDSSSDEDAANIAINKGLLFPNVGHKCLMAKDDKKKKVHSRDTPKYTTSDDEGSSSDDNDDLTSLFANLTKDQKKKINEPIESINEKDDLLECQEDLLVKENKKFVKLKNAYALEVEKCEILSKELNICNDSIFYLRDENASLNAKIDELNVCKPSTSTVEHVTFCTRCRDINVEAIDDHLPMIKEQNDHISKLNAKIVEHELEKEKFKFARSMLYNGRRPGIKDGIGFQQGSQSNIKLNAPQNKLSNFVKGKAPMV